MLLGHLSGRCLEYVHPKGDPQADPAHAGGTIAPVWPSNTMEHGVPQKELEEVVEDGLGVPP